MIELVLFVILVTWAGTRISSWLWRRFSPEAELSPFEKAASALLTIFILWLAIAWALAIPMLMNEWSLLAGAIVVAAAAATCCQPWRMRMPELTLAATIVVVPLALWTLFLLWRGWVAPPLGPDTLTYHMPRALLLSRAGGYAQFGLPETRIDQLAPNYELLLATILDLAHSDTVTEWLSIAFAGLFLIETAAMAHRWWRSNTGTAAAVLAVAAAPVFILHGAAHKNDVMTGAFFLAALHWLVRWKRTDELAAALLGIAGVAAGIGTKAHGFVLAAALLPFVARKVPLRRLAVYIAFGIAALALLGGEHYVYRAAPSSSIAAPVRKTAKAAEPSLRARVAPATWGDFSNIVEVPALMLLVPFAPTPEEVPVPWRGQAWLWDRYDVYASSFGWLFSIIAVAAPFVAWRTRRDGNHGERLLVTSAAMTFFLLVLPVRFVPRGYVSGFPRYTFIMLPVVVALTVPPLLAAVERHRAADGRRLALYAVALIAAYFIHTANDCIRKDKWAPLSALKWAAERPGVRWVPTEPMRAEFIVDRLAGPRDVIDVHGGFDSWLYPAFGADLQRDVRYINDASEVRPAAQWVVVDRAFGAVWGVRGFTSMGEWRRYLGRGTPSPEDLHVIEQLSRDPRFESVSIDRRNAQGVFRRRATSG